MMLLKFDELNSTNEIKLEVYSWKIQSIY
jgi:hypothetical protein